MAKKPGRPILENPNNPVVESPAQESAAATQPVAQVSLKDVAYGITKLPTGQYSLVRIKYDAVSGRTDVPELSIAGDDRYDAQERLKITLANELFS